MMGQPAPEDQAMVEPDGDALAGYRKAWVALGTWKQLLATTPSTVMAPLPAGVGSVAVGQPAAQAGCQT